MQLYDPKQLGAPSGGMFNPKEKKRMAFLVIGFVVIVLGLVTMQLQGKKRKEAGLDQLSPAAEPQLETEIKAPTIDVAALERVAADERPEQRMVLPGEALEAGFAQSGQVYDGVYGALGGRELSAALSAEIVADPPKHRGRLFRVRCFVEDLKELPNPADSDAPRYFVRGRLEDGAEVYFAVAEIVGIAPVPGDFARMDGLFVRVHREEVDGAWREAPLLVGPRMYESYALLEPVTALSPKLFEFVHDDSAREGLQGVDEESYWSLVSYAQNLKPGSVDWSKAPMLDNANVSSLFLDGTPWRGKAVQVPVARLLDIWVREQGDNPLRRDRMVEGWFGRGDWMGQVKVARFVAPWDAVPAGIKKNSNVVLRGFFYKNVAYQPKYGGLAIAPFFILDSVEPFLAPEPVGLRQLTYIVVGSLVLLSIAFYFIVRRDRARTATLEAELLRRRRERRQKQAQPANP